VRLLVRRPVDPARFNGTVLIEWLHVSPARDISPDWSWTHEELLREGYAYVGVTVQFLGARALQDWENGPADRYQGILLASHHDRSRWIAAGEAGLETSMETRNRQLVFVIHCGSAVLANRGSAKRVFSDLVCATSQVAFRTGA
jgi:hypothetical protein